MTYSSRFSTNRYFALYRIARITLSNPEILRPDLRQDAVAASQRVGRVESAREASELLSELKRCYFLSGESGILIRLGIPTLGYNPNYDLKANSAGPWMPIPFERPVVEGNSWDVFGEKIGIPIGIPASALTLNAKFVRFYAQSGFNVITYKTVRSKARPPHEPPHWFFLRDEDAPWKLGEIPEVVHTESREWPRDPSGFSTANSFGVPSADPNEWQGDVRSALNALAIDQLLILSVMGTDVPGGTKDDLVKDFVNVTRLGVETGVKVIEVNLSCPNVINPNAGDSGDRLICNDAELSACIVKECHDALSGNAQLVVKLAWMPEQELRQNFAPLISKGLLEGVAGINTLPTRVASWPDGNAFPNRPSAGVSGTALSKFSRDFLQTCLKIREETRHFEILVAGGLVTAEDIFGVLGAGATIAQSATGALVNAELAAECVDAYAQSGASDWPIEIPEPAQDLSPPEPTETMSTEKLMRVLSEVGGSCPFDELQGSLGLSRDEANLLISDGETLGLLAITGQKDGRRVILSDAGRDVLDVSKMVKVS